MRLSAPKQAVWVIAVILGVLGILGTFVVLPFVTVYSFWLVAAGFVLLALATLLDGM
jgi:hypothetical protein